MSKAKSTTKALTGPRQLKLLVPKYGETYDAVNNRFPAANNWQHSGDSVYYEGQIDVNLSLDDLTMVPQSMFLQDPGTYERTASLAGDPENQLIVIDIVSVKQLRVAQVIANAQAGIYPGMLGSPDDFNQILMGTYRLMAQNTNVPQSSVIQNTIDVKDFSSATPFAQDTLWCYRILIPETSALAGVFLGCPASRFLCQVVVGQEPDLAYMMRLKNSYELQQS
jgi:hypothetical protein